MACDIPDIIQIDDINECDKRRLDENGNFFDVGYAQGIFGLEQRRIELDVQVVELNLKLQQLDILRQAAKDLESSLGDLPLTEDSLQAQYDELYSLRAEIDLYGIQEQELTQLISVENNRLDFQRQEIELNFQRDSNNFAFENAQNGVLYDLEIQELEHTDALNDLQCTLDQNTENYRVDREEEDFNEAFLALQIQIDETTADRDALQTERDSKFTRFNKLGDKITCIDDRIADADDYITHYEDEFQLYLDANGGANPSGIVLSDFTQPFADYITTRLNDRDDVIDIRDDLLNEIAALDTQIIDLLNDINDLIQEQNDLVNDFQSGQQPSIIVCPAPVFKPPLREVEILEPSPIELDTTVLFEAQRNLDDTRVTVFNLEFNEQFLSQEVDNFRAIWEDAVSNQQPYNDFLFQSFDLELEIAEDKYQLAIDGEQYKFDVAEFELNTSLDNYNCAIGRVEQFSGQIESFKRDIERKNRNLQVLKEGNESEPYFIVEERQESKNTRLATNARQGTEGGNFSDAQNALFDNISNFDGLRVRADKIARTPVDETLIITRYIIINDVFTERVVLSSERHGDYYLTVAEVSLIQGPPPQVRIYDPNPVQYTTPPKQKVDEDKDEDEKEEERLRNLERLEQERQQFLERQAFELDQMSRQQENYLQNLQVQLLNFGIRADREFPLDITIQGATLQLNGLDNIEAILFDPLVNVENRQPLDSPENLVFINQPGNVRDLVEFINIQNEIEQRRVQLQNASKNATQDALEICRDLESRDVNTLAGQQQYLFAKTASELRTAYSADMTKQSYNSVNLTFDIIQNPQIKPGQLITLHIRNNLTIELVVLTATHNWEILPGGRHARTTTLTCGLNRGIGVIDGFYRIPLSERLEDILEAALPP